MIEKLTKLLVDIVNSPLFLLFAGAFAGYLFGEVKSKLDRKRQYDKNTHTKMLEFLKSDGFIFYINKQDVMGGYLNYIHKAMDEFHEFCLNPENFYIDKKLRKLQLDLAEAVESFNHILAINSMPTNNLDFSKPFQSRSHDHEDNRREFEEQKATLSALQDLIFQKTTELIITAKKIL